MEQIGMWVMEGNRVEKLDPSVSGVEGIVIYKIPGTPSITNPAGAAAPEAASKRVIWISAGGKKLYTKKMAVADTKTDTTVISAATDEVQENLIGEYVTAFTGTVNASTEKASVAVSFDMQYLEQKYTNAPSLPEYISQLEFILYRLLLFQILHIKRNRNGCLFRGSIYRAGKCRNIFADQMFLHLIRSCGNVHR